MKTISATKLARSLRCVLDRVIADGEEVVIERNHQPIARLVAGPVQQNAFEAMGDLCRTLHEDVAGTWETDARGSRWKGNDVAKGVRDPWAS